MKEQNEIERDLMSQEEFENYINNSIIKLNLASYNVIYKFKSVRRAAKRGHVTTEGYIIPRRPFNNRADTSRRNEIHSRCTNELKKNIYEQLRQYQRRTF